MFLALYVGRGEATFLADNIELNARLTADQVAHQFALYPGGHTLILWKTHATAWLTMALAHLSSVVNR